MKKKISLPVMAEAYYSDCMITTDSLSLPGFAGRYYFLIFPAGLPPAGSLKRKDEENGED